MTPVCSSIQGWWGAGEPRLTHSDAYGGQAEGRDRGGEAGPKRGWAAPVAHGPQGTGPGLPGNFQKSGIWSFMRNGSNCKIMKITQNRPYGLHLVLRPKKFPRPQNCELRSWESRLSHSPVMRTLFSVPALAYCSYLSWVLPQTQTPPQSCPSTV